MGLISRDAGEMEIWQNVQENVKIFFIENRKSLLTYIGGFGKMYMKGENRSQKSCNLFVFRENNIRFRIHRQNSR